jgi:uncharacterized protein
LQNLKTKRTKVSRIPKRASYDRKTIYDILDAAFVCHIAFVINNQAFIIPTIFGRKDDLIFIHGSKNSRMLKSFSSGEDICIAVTLIDGIVLARSAFHHSVNYRSVIIFGKPEKIFNKDEKTKAMEIIMNHIVPVRWNEIRKPNGKELNSTSVFSIKINEASAKIRTGGASDEKEDYLLNVWAGILPLKIVSGKPIRDPGLQKNISLPEYIKNYKT